MKIKKNAELFAFFLICALFAVPLFAQKRPPVKTKQQTIVFAVLNNGKTVEPIGFIDKGELVAAVDGASEPAVLSDFSRTYFKPKTSYRLVFGGTEAGSVTIVKNDPKAECSKNLADVTFASTRAKLSGMVMGLATNAALKKGEGMRRRPTPEERAEIEKLVRAEFSRQKVAASVTKNLKSHNLTALDVDADGRAEMVGTFWVEPSATVRATLFFIAEKGSNGKYEFGYSNYASVKQDDVMSGDIKSLDEGIYHELLLDVMEYDGDTTAEIFTYAPSFEGNGFNAYSRRNGKWVKVFEGSNYHCGY